MAISTTATPPTTPTTATTGNPPNGPGAQVDRIRRPRRPRVAQESTPAQDDGKPVTVQIPEELHRRVRVLSAATGQSVTAMVVEALEAKIRKELRAALAGLTDE